MKAQSAVINGINCPLDTRQIIFTGDAGETFQGEFFYPLTNGNSAKIKVSFGAEKGVCSVTYGSTQHRVAVAVNGNTVSLESVLPGSLGVIRKIEIINVPRPWLTSPAFLHIRLVKDPETTGFFFIGTTDDDAMIYNIYPPPAQLQLFEMMLMDRLTEEAASLQKHYIQGQTFVLQGANADGSTNFDRKYRIKMH